MKDFVPYHIPYFYTIPSDAICLGHGGCCITCFLAVRYLTQDFLNMENAFKYEA